MSFRALTCGSLVCGLLIFPLVAQEENEDSLALALPSCPTVDSLKIVKKKKALKALKIRVAEIALDSSQCVEPLHKIWGDRNANWKKLRKSLPDRQPDAMLQLYGTKKLKADERKTIFFSKKVIDSLTCVSLADSVGLEALSGKNWLQKSSRWDSLDFPCKTYLTERVQPLIEALPDSAMRRAKMLAVYPEIWFDQYAESSNDSEKVAYATNPSLHDSTHCNYVDYATADLLEQHGSPANACQAYIHERWGAPLLRMAFRKSYKPAILAQINKRLTAVTPENLDSIQGLLDTIEILFGDGESWEVLDSLEVSVLNLIAKNPIAIKQFQDPTATMLLAAFDAQLTLLCDYPNVTDRMLGKLLSDRAADGKPLPTEEERQQLDSCLAPDLSGALHRFLDQLQQEGP
ncbi:MAG TPA: hypothetical protein VLM37_06845 [Fibrobacteraceae bacterium]|nr:hypothetical protein [Fibrobacteraceae bacterium]